MKVSHALQGLRAAVPLNFSHASIFSVREMLERSNSITSHSFREEHIPTVSSLSKRKMICIAPMSSMGVVLVGCHQKVGVLFWSLFLFVCLQDISGSVEQEHATLHILDLTKLKTCRKSNKQYNKDTLDLSSSGRM